MGGSPAADQDEKVEQQGKTAPCSPGGRALFAAAAIVGQHPG